MKITIESTSKIVDIDGVPARIWEGQSETGVPVVCFVTRVAVAEEADHSQFERELQETRAPSAAVDAFPLRLIL